LEAFLLAVVLDFFVALDLVLLVVVLLFFAMAITSFPTQP